jgi:hypothetical protein
MAPDRRAFGGVKVARMGGKFKGSEADSHVLEHGWADKMSPLPKRASDEAGEGARSRSGEES